MTLVKVNALIECLTAILESIDLILVGRASHKITFHATYCALHKMNMHGMSNNLLSFLRYPSRYCHKSL